VDERPPSSSLILVLQDVNIGQYSSVHPQTLRSLGLEWRKVDTMKTSSLPASASVSFPVLQSWVIHTACEYQYRSSYLASTHSRLTSSGSWLRVNLHTRRIS
jgi:hypothetical protein